MGSPTGYSVCGELFKHEWYEDDGCIGVTAHSAVADAVAVYLVDQVKP
jgi:hypothetical protein